MTTCPAPCRGKGRLVTRIDMMAAADRPTRPLALAIAGPFF
nr:MAG TPA: hypothetical protein [Caudoviricetes sp.]